MEINKYNNAKIYCIKSANNNEMYIGSTCKKYLSSRLSQHRYDFINWIDGRRPYCSSFNVLCKDDTYIELLEAVNVNTGAELRALEKQYILNNINNVVNKYYLKGN